MEISCLFNVSPIITPFPASPQNCYLQNFATEISVKIELNTLKTLDKENLKSLRYMSVKVIINPEILHLV